MFSFLSCYLWFGNMYKRGPKKHGLWHIPHRPPSPHIMMNHCSFDGCENRPTKNGNGRCHTHGGRTKCNHLGCDSFAQKGGKCGSHRPDKICCSATGCTNLPQKNGVCKTHGGTRICEIHGCTGRFFQSRMCNFHYKNSIVCTAINENAMVGEDDFSRVWRRHTTDVKRCSHQGCGNYSITGVCNVHLAAARVAATAWGGVEEQSPQPTTGGGCEVVTADAITGAGGGINACNEQMNISHADACQLTLCLSSVVYHHGRGLLWWSGLFWWWGDGRLGLEVQSNSKTNCR